MATECKNESYVNYLSEELNHDSPENKVRIAITLAHEFRRNATSDSVDGETRNIILEDTKIIESFANAYGEEIYKKFPEYGILHYIKKIFGETGLKEFADYAFDSTGSYWKVNEAGDLIDDGKSSRVADSKGNELYSGTKGLQGTLQEWLGMENAYASLMQPVGFEWDGRQWSKKPGRIDHSVIEKAHNDGLLTDDQYNLIQLAAGKSASDDDKSEKISLFKQLFNDYKQANVIKTQVQVDMANRAWEWLQIQWKKRFGKNSSAENKTDKYNQLNERYEKVKNVKYSNDTTKIDYDSNYKPLDTTTYFNCIGFVCYMYNISASYSVSNFDKYTQFSELKDIKNVNQLQIGDVITWEYESGKVDKNSKPIYEYHVSIWKGNDEIWECMDPNGVRVRNYKKYYDYMNTHNMKIKTVKYFRYKGKNNEKILFILFLILLLNGCFANKKEQLIEFMTEYIETVSSEHAKYKTNITEKMHDFYMDYENKENATMPEFMAIGPFRANIIVISNYEILGIKKLPYKDLDGYSIDVRFLIKNGISTESKIINYWVSYYKNKFYIYGDSFLQDIYILEKDL